jgi:hypothetical protein
MLNSVIALCTTRTGLYWLVVLSDLSVAAAYFGIPITMAIVFWRRKSDLPFPWLWALFIAFITACGLTHFVHAWSALTGTDDLPLLATVGVFCALASTGTAVAFAWVLPSIRLMPSPKQQREELERAVTRRTREKDRLLHEIHHRLGNQLQVLNSIVSIETKRAKTSEAVEALARVRDVLDGLGKDYRRRSKADYLAEAWCPGDASAFPAQPELSLTAPLR